MTVQTLSPYEIKKVCIVHTVRAKPKWKAALTVWHVSKSVCFTRMYIDAHTHTHACSVSPGCTSLSLSAQLPAPSSQAEWLQTGRDGSSAEVVLLLVLTREDMIFLLCSFFFFFFKRLFLLFRINNRQPFNWLQLDSVCALLTWQNRQHMDVCTHRGWTPNHDHLLDLMQFSGHDNPLCETYDVDAPSPW